MVHHLAYQELTFSKLTLICFAQGHTKNATDFLYNIRKRGHHNKNIHINQEMFELLDYN